MALLLGSATAGAVTATLSVPATDYDGTFVVSWNVDPGPAGGYTLLYQNGIPQVQKGFGSQSHTVSVADGGSYVFRVHYAYMPENPCGESGPGCNPSLIHGDTPSKTTVVTLTPPSSAPTLLPQPATDNNGSYTVTWNAVSAAQTYQWQERVNGGSWSGATTISGTSLSRSGKSSATYGYHVRACNPNGCSGYSAPKSIIVAVTPGVPSSLSASPNPSTGNVTVSWGSASGSVTKYDFDYKKSTVGSWSNGYDGTGLSKALTSLAAGTWNYRVRACKTQSSYTSCSGWRMGSSTIALPPAVPGGLTAPPPPDSDGAYTVSWNSVSTASSYTLQRRMNGGSWTTIQNTSATSRSESGLGSASYGYHVRACNAAGCSSYSAEKPTIVAVTPGVPSSISASPNPSTGNVTVSWGSASGSVTKYDFDYKKSTAGSWSDGYDGPNLSKALSGLAEGTWNYRVRACKTVSTYTSYSGWRTGSSTIYIPPEFNLSSPADNVTGSYTVTWDPVAGTALDLQERVGGGSWTTLYTGEDDYFPISGRDNGSYDYRIAMDTVQVGTVYSSISTTDVQIPAPPAIQTGIVAGNMPYQTGVTKGGNGYITVPLTVVPGVNGLQPNLGIVYNSGRQRQQIDDVLPGDTLGYGFSVTGIPSIRRCVKNQPNEIQVKIYDMATDRLCLNGEPLILVAGTDYWAADAEYRTLRESYHRVYLRGTPLADIWFEVHSPDGSISEFGNTEGSRIRDVRIQNLPMGQGQIVYETLPYYWSINRQIDAFGNEIEYTYYKDEFAGVNHPATIAYGDNGDTVIQFGYSGRSDTWEVDFGEATLQQNLLLHSVNVLLDGNLVRKYVFDSEYAPAPYYWRRLDKLQVCAYDEGGGNEQCLAPLDFTWAEPIAAAPDLKTFVSHVTDPLGATTSFEYELITESDPHDFLFSERPFGNEVVPPDTQPIEPLPNEDGLKYVVTQVTRDNGVNGVHATSYAYHGRGLDSTMNWGFLGFYGARITDETSGIVTYHQYRLDFPHFAETSRTRQFDAVFGAHTLELTRSETAFSERTVNYSLGSTVLPYAAATTSFLKEGTADLGIVQTKNDLDPLDSNGFIPGMRMTTTVATAYTTTSGGSFWGAVPSYTPTSVLRTVESDQVFDNDTSGTNWLIGFTDWAQTRHYRGAPASAPLDQTQSVDYTRHGATNAVHTQEFFPGDAEYELVTTYGYDAYGNVNSRTVSGVNVASRTSTSSPGSDPRYPSATSNALSHETQLVFDPRFGSLEAVTDPNGRVTLVYFDNFGREISRTTPDQVTITTEYKRCGIEVTCASVANALHGAVTPVVRVQTSSPISPVRRTYLDVLGRTVRTEVQSFDGTYVRQDVQYDNQGRVKRASLPYLAGQTAYFITFDYDLRDRVTKKVAPDGGETWVSYSSNQGKVEVVEDVKVKNSQGQLVDTQTKRSVYNVLGEVVSTTDDEGGENVRTDYDYYATGLPKTVSVDPSGANLQTTFVFDDARHRTSVTDPDAGTVTSLYTALGELRQTTRNGTLVTNYSYDVLGRIKTKTDADGQATWTYDPANARGAIASRSYGTQFDETFSYNGDARLQTVTTELDGGGMSKSYVHSYLYDTYGRTDKITYPSGIQTAYTFNARGYLASIKDAATGAILTSYASMDAFGNVTEQHFANGVEALRSFDPETGRLVTIDATLSGGTTVQDNEYQWQSNGILESRIQALGGATRQEVFSYDGLNRLEKSETFVNSVLARTLDMNFDARGNLQYKTSSVAADTDVTAYTPVAGKNRFASAIIGGAAWSFDYDAHGAIVRYDRLSSGDDKFIDWNARNLPERITVGASAGDATPTARDEFAYGPDGQRFYRKSTWQDGGTQRVEHTFYVGSFEELVTDPQDTVLNAVQKSRIGDSLVHIRTFPDVGAPVSRIEYLHRDHLGSVEAVTDDAGALVRTLAYDPYGGRRSGDWLGELDAASTGTLADDLRESSTRGYTGHEQLDRTGFIHMNGRVYDPVLGRFLSPDPIVQNPTYSQSWNRYSYVMNSPMSFTDPTGYVRAGSICNTGLIMCMNGDGGGVGGSNASFSVPRKIETIRTSGSTYSSWVPTGREFVITGATFNIFGETVTPPVGEYRDTGYHETRYAGGASVSVKTISIQVNTKESSETDEPASDSAATQLQGDEYERSGFSVAFGGGFSVIVPVLGGFDASVHVAIGSDEGYGFPVPDAGLLITLGMPDSESELPVQHSVGADITGQMYNRSIRDLGGKGRALNVAIGPASGSHFYDKRGELVGLQGGGNVPIPVILPATLVGVSETRTYTLNPSVLGLYEGARGLATEGFCSLDPQCH